MTPEQQKIIERTAKYAQETLSGESSGHDWWHVYRVWMTARHIAKQESADSYVVELAALLHDIADYKMHGGDTEIGPQTAAAWLTSQHVSSTLNNSITSIIRDISFKGAGVAEKSLSIEGKIVQDADRLDAMGAIGIARAFAFGGSKNRILHDPEIAPVHHASFAAYKDAQGTTINHFHEKLLLLKDKMNTKTGKRIAEERHAFMQEYLEEFHREWEGKA